MISTRGFGIDVMPQVYQAAPENLSVNPNLITKGILDAFEVNDKLARLNAFKLQQQEINANRAARIDEERARLGYSSLSHDANASLVAPKADLERLRIASDIFNQPKESAVKSQGLDYLLLKTAGAIAQQPHLNAAGLIDAQGLAERAGTENSLKGLDVTDKFTNFDVDAAQKRAGVSSQIAKDMAAAAQAKAMADDIATREQRAADALKSREKIAESKLNAIREKASSLEKDTLALEKLADARSSEAARTSLLTASDPAGSKTAYKLVDVFPLAYEQNKAGDWVPRQNGIFFRKDIKINPIDKANLERLAEQQNQAIGYLKKANSYREQLLQHNEQLRAGMPTDEVATAQTPTTSFKTPDDVKAALKSGQIKSVEEAKKILVQQFGFTP